MSSNSINAPLDTALKEQVISATTYDNTNNIIQGNTNSINNINPSLTEAINNENNKINQNNNPFLNDNNQPINKNNKLSHENLFSPTDNFINTVITNSKSNDSIMNETPLVSQNNQDLFNTPYIEEINNEYIPTESANSINKEQKQKEENSFENNNSTVTPKTQTENPYENSLNINHDYAQIEEGIKLKNYANRKSNVGEIPKPEIQTQPEKIQLIKTNIPSHVENLFMDINDIVSPINIIDAVMHNQSNQKSKQSQNAIDFNLIPSIEDESPIAEQPLSAFPIQDVEEDIDDLIDHELSQCNYIEKVESDNNATNNKKLHGSKSSDLTDVHENNPFETQDIHKDHIIMAKTSIQKKKLNEEAIETKVDELNENNAKDGKNKLEIEKNKIIENKESSLNTNNKCKLEKTKTTSKAYKANRSNDVFARLTKGINSSTSKNKSPISKSPSSHNSTHSPSIHTQSQTAKTTTSINKLMHKPLNRSSSSSTTSSKSYSFSSSKPTTKKPISDSPSTTSANSNTPKISLLHKPSSIDTTLKSSSPKPHSSASRTGTISPKSSLHKSTTTSSTTTKATNSSSSPPTSNKPKLSVTSIITKPKVSVNTSTTKPKINTSASDSSKTSKIGVALKTATSKTPSKSSTPYSDKIRYSLTSSSPSNRISAVSKLKSGVTTFNTQMTSTTITNSQADKEIIEKQSKEIEKLEQMIKELNNQIEEQALISFVSKKQDLNTINDLKEKLKQLSENNNENNNIDEFTEFMNESFNIIENLAFLIDSQEQNYGKLKIEAAKINQNLANVTLLCDNEHNKRIIDEKIYKKKIQRLQEMATSLNDSLSKVTLLCDEIKNEHFKGIENLNNILQNTNQPSLHDLSESTEINKLHHELADINSRLANVTLLCDQITKEKNNNINNLEQQVLFFKKLAIELNNRIINLTFHCDQVEYNESSTEKNSDYFTLTQELNECKMMLEQKDISIEQLQMQIKQLEQKDLVIQQLQMKIEQLEQKNTNEENVAK